MSEHIRTNVIGYIALFCFVVGGTAQALPGKNSVDTGDIKKGQVRGSDVRDGDLTGADLKDGAVASGDLADGSIVTVKLADGSVTTAKLANDAVTGAKVAPDSITGADVDETSLDLPEPPAPPTTLPPSGAAGGELTGTYPNPQIAPLAVAAGKLAPNAIPADGSGTDGTTKLATGAVDGDEIASDAVGAAEVLNGSLNAADVTKQVVSFSGTVSVSVPAEACTFFPVSAASSTASTGDRMVPITNTGTNAGVILEPTVQSSGAGIVDVRICATGAAVVNPAVTASFMIFD